jgi:hypothetical protein
MSDHPPEPEKKLGDNLTVLKMHVDIANGEKQAIWTRHATMLVGNSIIVAAARSDQNAGQFLSIVGLLLCGAWAWMTWVGWEWFHKSLRAGADIKIEPMSNPFAEFSNPSRRDAIFIVAMVVIGLFALIYLYGLCHSFAH